MRPSWLPGAFGQLLGLAWPIVIARSTQVVVGVSDALLVAHLGESALAATADGGLIAFALLVLPVGIVSIVSAFTSQLMGAGSPAAARRFAVYGLAMALVTQIVTLALLPSIPWALSHFEYSPGLGALMAGYVRVRLLSAGAAVGLEALASYYCGAGKPRLPMLASLSALLLNVAGNWLLIDGHLGLPAMGVNGSALASTLATTCAFAALLGVFLVHRGGAQESFASLSVRELRRLLRFGLPVGISGALEALAFTFFVNVVVARFGTTTLAAMMTVLQISALPTLPAFAFASAGAVLVGQAIGAGAREEVPRRVRTTLVSVAAWQAIVAVGYVLLSRRVLGLFVTGAPNAQAFVDTATVFLLLSAAWTSFEAMSATYAEALGAAGDTAITLGARATVLTVVFAPGAWLLAQKLHASCTAVISWYVTCAALLVAILYQRFHGGAWRRIRLTSVAAHRLVDAAEA